MMIYKISDEDYLEIRKPDIPQFVEDEIEIWLISPQREMCIFKDSFKDVLSTESNYVINSFKVQKPLKVCFTELYKKYWLEHSENLYKDYLLFEFQDCLTWLSKEDNDNARLEIWEIDVFDANHKDINLFSDTFSSNGFIEWWDKILQMGNYEYSQKN